MIQTLARLLVIFRDNLTRNISPANERDFIETSIGAILTTDPTPDDDNVNTAGNGYFDAGQYWLNTVGPKVWECVDGTATMADWILIYPQGGGAVAPLLLQPPTDSDYALALKQHSATQSGPLMQALDSLGGTLGPKVTPTGHFTDAGPGASSMTTGNERFGDGSLNSLAGGLYNTGLGWLALTGMTTGIGNTGVGVLVAPSALSPTKTTALGFEACFETIGGVYNTGLGAEANRGTAYGDENTAVGFQAGLNFNDHSHNVSVGNNSGQNPGGNENTSVGYHAGYSSPGGQCTLLGAGADVGSSSHVWSTAVGYQAQTTASHQIMLGTATETVEFPGNANFANPPTGIGGIASDAGAINGTSSAGPGWTTIKTLTGANGLIGWINLYTTSPGLPFVLDWQVNVTDPRNGTQVYNNTSGVIGGARAFEYDFSGAACINSSHNLTSTDPPVTTFEVQIRTHTGFSDCDFTLAWASVSP